MAKKKRAEPVIRVTVGLDQSDHEQLSRFAGGAGVSLAWVLRLAAKELIERVNSEETELKIMPRSNAL